MSILVNLMVRYFALAFAALGAQNVIFARGLGLSSGIRILNHKKKNIFYFCGALTVFQLLTTILVYFAAPLTDAIGQGQYRRFMLPTLIVIASMLSYVVIVTVLSAKLNKDAFKTLLESITNASLTNTIVGTVILTSSQGLTLMESIAFGIGSSVGYFLAIILIAEGHRKIHHKKVPASFRGLPITLIYISVLALAIYGFTGGNIVW